MTQKKVKNKLTPLRAIREHCLECEDGARGVARCKITGCPLYPFRLGKLVSETPSDAFKGTSQRHKHKS